jgi:hypothetical protein
MCASILCVVAASIGCNGGTQSNPNMPEGDGPHGAGPTRVVEGNESFDVSPVAEPGVQVVHVRWKSPGANLATAARVMRLPPAFVNANVRVVVEEIVGELLRDKADVKAFAEVVEVDAPIEFAMVADTSRGGPVPEPIWGVSLGLSSIGKARDASTGRPHSLGPGLWRVGPPAQPWEGVCAIAASTGKTPARLVCSDSERMLVRMAPYMARNVPNIPDAPSDLHAELNLRPLFDKYGKDWARQVRGLPVLLDEFAIGNPKFDDALKDAGAALVSEAGQLMQDADKITLDGTLNESEGLTITAKAAFAGSKSWVVQTLVQGVELSGPAPEIFWFSPASSESVRYARSGNPAQYEKMLDIGRRLIEGFLEKEKVATPADRKALAKLLRIPFKKGAGTVLASGHFPSRGRSAAQDIVDATVGWQLFGIEDGPAATKGYLDDLAGAYNRAGFQAWLKKEMGSDAKNLPIVKQGKAPEGFGAGSSALEIVIPKLEEPSLAPPPVGRHTPPPKPKTSDAVVHVLFMPDGARTWVGVAGDRDALAQLMKGVKGQKPGPETIATRADLAAFKTGKHASGGYTTVDGMLGSVRPMIAMMARGGSMAEMEQVKRALERMPNKGKTPIVVVGDVKGGGRPSLTFTGRLGRDSLVDLGFLITQAMEIATRSP